MSLLPHQIAIEFCSVRKWLILVFVMAAFAGFELLFVIFSLDLQITLEQGTKLKRIKKGAPKEDKDRSCVHVNISLTLKVTSIFLCFLIFQEEFMALIDIASLFFIMILLLEMTPLVSLFIDLPTAGASVAFTFSIITEFQISLLQADRNTHLVGILDFYDESGLEI
ncbi:hypothetical protein ACJX0J_039199 [Zea mays]